jgi:hypothetical protein
VQSLFEAFPEIETAIVEDLPDITRKNQESPPPEDIANRIKYQAYDFFIPQPVRNADVYVFRTVLHDWQDQYAIRILLNQIPALKPGAHIIINDVCLEAYKVQNMWINQAQWKVYVCNKEHSCTNDAILGFQQERQVISMARRIT